MTIQVDDVATELGLTSVPDDRRDQWQSWIDQTYRMIDERARTKRVALDPNNPLVGDVVRWAVVRRITRPVDGAESTTDQIGIDVGSWNQTRRYPAGHGDIHILDQWWDLIGLGTRRRAFTIRPGRIG